MDLFRLSLRYSTGTVWAVPGCAQFEFQQGVCDAFGFDGARMVHGFG
jgi:hypothetical protein